MKKYLTLLLALLLALSLAGCSRKPTSAAGDGTAAEPSAGPTATPVPTPEPTPAPPTEEELMGGLDGSGDYVNTVLGLGFRAPEGWNYMGRGDMDNLVIATGDMIGDEELSDTLTESRETGKDRYCMMAYASSAVSAVSLSLEKPDPTTGILPDEDAYLEAGQDALVRSLESMGFFGVGCQRETVSVGGRELPGLRVWGSLNGLTYYELLAVEKAGDCMFVIMAESTYEAGCRELMDCWYALD